MIISQEKVFSLQSQHFELRSNTFNEHALPIIKLNTNVLSLIKRILMNRLSSFFQDFSFMILIKDLEFSNNR